MDQQPTGKKREIIAALSVLIVVVVIATGAAIANKKKADGGTSMVSTTQSDNGQDDTSDPTSGNGDTSANTGSTSSSDPGANAPATPASAYKDGSYSATGSYDSPGGRESITVNVTLKNDVVTATSAQGHAGDPEAEEYQSDFISGYKQLAVGKSIGSLHLSRVSGSSLTSQGFNGAIQQIKNQAKNG